MDNPNLNPEDTKILIENLQQTNKLIRFRALILAFFLVLMMGVFLTINQNKTERRNLDRCYNQLMALFPKDSMKVILERDSLKYLYKTNLGAYMSLEVLYDKLAQDSFKNREPLYQALDQVDEVLRNEIRKEKEATISIAGFTVPIRPIMIVAPIILLLLYHEFSILMLYRKNLEDKIIHANVGSWKIGPEAVSHYMFDFIPLKFRYVKKLWAGIQLIVLFIPTIPACYFSIYGGSESAQVGTLVIVSNFICCIIILANFLMLIDNENLLGIRDTSMVFTGQMNSIPSSKIWYNRTSLHILTPLFLGCFTFLAFHYSSSLNIEDSLYCSITAFTQAVVLVLLCRLRIRFKSGEAIFRLFIGAAFFACFFWIVIDILACLGAIRFKDFEPLDYIIVSLMLAFVGYLIKFIYLIYIDRSEKRMTKPS